MKTIGPQTRRAQLRKRQRRRALKATAIVAEFAKVIDQARADGCPQWLLASKIDQLEVSMMQRMPKNMVHGIIDGLKARAFR